MLLLAILSYTYAYFYTVSVLQSLNNEHRKCAESHAGENPRISPPHFTFSCSSTRFLSISVAGPTSTCCNRSGEVLKLRTGAPPTRTVAPASSHGASASRPDVYRRRFFLKFLVIFINELDHDSIRGSILRQAGALTLSCATPQVRK
jgi:hypothetical protein